jgi:hypothetical protein
VVFCVLYLILKGESSWKAFLAYTLGAILASRHLLPLAFIGGHLEIAGTSASILSRRSTLAEFLGLGASASYTQLGWPFAAALLLLLFRRTRALLASAEFQCFAIAGFLILSPLPWDFWEWMGPLKNVQVPLRLLPFSALFGMILVSKAWDELEEGRRKSFLAVSLFGALLLALPQGVPAYGPFSPRQHADFYKKYGMLNGCPDQVNGRFVLEEPLPPSWERHWPSLALKGKPKNLGVGLDWSGEGEAPKLLDYYHARFSSVELEGKEAGVLLLPAPWYPGMYRINLDGKNLSPGHNGNRLALALGPGRHRIEFCFKGWIL